MFLLSIIGSSGKKLPNIWMQTTDMMIVAVTVLGSFKFKKRADLIRKLRRYIHRPRMIPILSHLTQEYLTSAAADQKYQAKEQR
jgi:hypothetical protein